jgi:LysR family transcriptional regulator, transcriptional activator of nhaA
MNYKHLYYFWATASAGGVMRASEQLHVTPQTLSGQIKLLEGRLGCALFAKSGRRLELTSAGRTALRYADQIFALGQELEAAMDAASGVGDRLDFRVGVSDSVPKAIAYRLLEPALDVDRPVRLMCHEGQFDDLLGRLAVHKLDLVLADEPMRREMSVRAFNHALGVSALTFFATPALKASLPRGFPKNLQGAPMLVPTYAGIRGRFERWCSVEGIHVNVVAELDDSALITAFGREGRGVFMAPTVLERDICAQNGVVVFGRTDDLLEEFFAISVERRITHPCVEAITQSARDRLFHSEARAAK